MSTNQFDRCGFEDELAALIAQNQSSDVQDKRQALFEALLDLEDRAKAGAASMSALRKIAEARFLVGILRDAVRPVPVVSLRTVLRARGRAGRGSGARALAAADLDA
ncbi:hypothetical protein ACLBX9_09225 [Methylobacterium sp. A49B]